MTDCLFCKIVKGEIPCKKVYEDDEILAFHDIHPAAPAHCLIIPKVHLDRLSSATQEHATLLGRLLLQASPIAQQLGFSNGYRTIINVGYIGGQEVYHLHVHVLSGHAPLGPILSR